MMHKCKLTVLKTMLNEDLAKEYGIEEELKPGVMHICPKGSEHSIVNTGEKDLVMLTIVVKK